MASKFLISFFVIFSSFFNVGLSQISAVDLLQTPTQTSNDGSMQCMQKLLPCQNYLKNSSDPPPTCCLPLKEMIVNDKQCFCKILNDPKFFKSANITQDDAFKLPKNCGLEANISICDKGASSPTSSDSTPFLLASQSDGGATTYKEDATKESSTTKITATMSTIVTLLIALIKLSAQ